VHNFRTDVKFVIHRPKHKSLEPSICNILNVRKTVSYKICGCIYDLTPNKLEHEQHQWFTTYCVTPEAKRAIDFEKQLCCFIRYKKYYRTRNVHTFQRSITTRNSRLNIKWRKYRFLPSTPGSLKWYFPFKLLTTILYFSIPPSYSPWQL
jgi:hypothetical protein